MQEKVQVPVDQCKSLVVDRNRQYTYLVVVVVVVVVVVAVVVVGVVV
jgi:hypothetical protein